MSTEIDVQDLLDSLSGGVSDKNLIQTRYSTLFVEEEQEVVNISAGEHAGYKGIPATFPIETPESSEKFTLYISEFHHDNSSQHTILHRLRQATPNSSLHIRLDSPGGYCYEGIKLQSIMREKFKGNAITYNDVQAASMGAFIFSSGDKRVMNEYATVMYHNYSGGMWGDGAALKAQFENLDEIMTRMDKELLVGNKFLSEKEFDEMVKFNRQWYFNTKECAKRGIATHVIVRGEELTAEQYLEYLESGFTFEEYLEYLGTGEEEEEVVSIDLAELMKLFGTEEQDGEE